MRFPRVRFASLLACLAAANAMAQVPGVPQLKAGLWEATTTSDRPAAKAMGPQVESVCVDASIQPLLLVYEQEMSVGKCADYGLKVAGNVVTGEAVCQVGGSTKKVTSTLKFNGNTALRVESDAAYTPPNMGMSKLHTVVDLKYVGPCPAGWQPGDVRAAQGPGINLKGIQTMPALKKGT